jgi:hypothetical protein
VICEADRSDEAIAAPVEGFNVPGALRVISQHGANLLNAKVNAALEVYSGVFTPKAKLNFFPADDLATAFGEQEERSKRLRMQFQGDSGFAQFAVRGVQFKTAETDDRGVPDRSRHKKTPRGSLRNHIIPGMAEASESSVPNKHC